MDTLGYSYCISLGLYSKEDLPEHEGSNDPKVGQASHQKKRVHTALKKIPQKLSQQNQESRNLSKPERKISSNFLVSMFQ